MINASRTHAESRFEAIERRQQKVMSEQEEKARARDEQTARLRAMRLAKEEKDNPPANVLARKLMEKRRAAR